MIINPNKTAIIRHSLAWIFLTITIYILNPFKDNLFVQLLRAIILAFNYITIYYLMIIIIPYLWKISPVMLIPASGIFWAIFVLLLFYSYRIPISLLCKEFNSYQRIQMKVIIDHSYINYLITLVAAFSSFSNELSMKQLRAHNEREELLLTKELDFLKNQFNAHIMFNFLNFCYSHVHKSSEEAAEAIDLFSGMLRYSLKSNSQEKVPLVEEIKYIEDFIELQTMMNDKTSVNFHYDGVLNNTFLLPRILITVIEEAFNHGGQNNPDHPLYISILAKEDLIDLSINYKKNASLIVEDSEKEHDNIKQILDLYYPNNYELRIDNSSDNYSYHLSLKNLL